MEHKLKILPCYFERVLDGSKTFEVRDNSDRGFQMGDSVLLQEYSQDMVEIPKHELEPNVIRGERVIGYTGAELRFTIGYVFPLAEDKCVFSLIKK